MDRDEIVVHALEGLRTANFPGQGLSREQTFD